jgi:hypothetical protein
LRQYVWQRYSFEAPQSANLVPQEAFAFRLTQEQHLALSERHNLHTHREPLEERRLLSHPMARSDLNAHPLSVKQKMLDTLIGCLSL